jgi:hypothetical protein
VKQFIPVAEHQALTQKVEDVFLPIVSNINEGSEDE